MFLVKSTDSVPSEPMIAAKPAHWMGLFRGLLLSRFFSEEDLPRIRDNFYRRDPNFGQLIVHLALQLIKCEKVITDLILGACVPELSDGSPRGMNVCTLDTIIPYELKMSAQRVW